MHRFIANAMGTLKHDESEPLDGLEDLGSGLN